VGFVAVPVNVTNEFALIVEAGVVTVIAAVGSWAWPMQPLLFPVSL
jgi:hypothetical protein